MIRFSYRLLCLLLLCSCGTHLVIYSWGLRRYEVSMDPTEGMEVAYETRAHSFFGPLNRDLISIEEVLKEGDFPRRRIGDFEVITSYSVSDVFWSLIPFYSSRTVELKGKVGAEKEQWYK